MFRLYLLKKTVIMRVIDSRIRRREGYQNADKAFV